MWVGVDCPLAQGVWRIVQLYGAICRCDRVCAIVPCDRVVRFRRAPVCRRASFSLAVVTGATQGRQPLLVCFWEEEKSITKISRERPYRPHPDSQSFVTKPFVTLAGMVTLSRGNNHVRAAPACGRTVSLPAVAHDGGHSDEGWTRAYPLLSCGIPCPLGPSPSEAWMVLPSVPAWLASPPLGASLR